MAQHDVFLSHNSADKPAVEEIARRLRREGVEPWLDKWDLIPGVAWQEAIEKALAESAACAVFIGPGGFNPWHREETRVAISRRVQEGHGQFRVIPVLLPGVERPERGKLPAFLTAVTWVEFRASLDEDDAIHRLVCGIRGVEPDLGPDGAIFDDGRCPYRGLEVFDEAHASFFFGREALIEWLLAALRPSVPPGRENRFLAILGPSGSGKSSLALAGLVPALRRGALDGSAAWPIAIVRPGPDPLEGLAVRLAGREGGAPDPSAVLQLMKGLADDPRALHLSARHLLHDAPPGARLVVLVDQFEEVFTLSDKEPPRRALIDNLHYAASVAGGRTVVVLTMRADFYGKCATYLDLAAAMSDHQVLVGPMTEDELRRAIERPAQLVGCEFGPGLVETLLHDVKQQPGALPLLQFALKELWQRRDGRRLTTEAYREMGGLQGALKNRANSILLAFSEPERELCRRIFLRLTQPGEGTEDTKRRASFRELSPSEGDTETTRAVVNRLVDARLITSEGDEHHREEGFVEVAHEALIRGWPELRQWIEADRAGLRTHRRLTEAAHEWEINGRDDSFLYTGARLSAASEWSRDHHHELNPLEAEFLAVSQARSAGELVAARRSASRLYRLTLVSLLAGVIAIVLATVAFFERKEALDARDQAKSHAQRATEKTAEAERQTRFATAQRLAAQSQAVLETFPERSLLLAVEAIHATLDQELRPPSAEQSLRLALGSTGGHPLVGHKGPINAVAITPDGRHLVTAGVDETARVWDFNDLDAPPKILLGQEGRIDAVAISPDSRRLVTADHLGDVRVWDLNDLDAPPKILPDQEGLIFAVAISPDGRRLVTAGDRTACVRDLNDLDAPPRIISSDEDTIFAVAISPDSRRLVIAGNRGRARVWDLTDLDAQPYNLGGRGDSIYAVAISPDGRRLVTAGGDGTAQVRDLNDLDAELKILRGHEGWIRDVAISSDGRRLVTTGDDKTARVWDFNDLDAPPKILRGHDDSISAVAISPDSRRFVTAGNDGIARVWDFNDLDTQPKILRGHEGRVFAVAISPDSRRLVTAGQDSTARVWDLNDLVAPPRILGGHKDSIYAVAISPDSRRLVTAGQDSTARVWDLNDLDTPPRILGGHADRIYAVAISPDSRRLVTASSIEIAGWDLNDLDAPPRIISGFNGYSIAMAISPDGRRLVTAGDHGYARVWDFNDLDAEPKSLPGHENSINDVAISPDSRRLITVSDDRTARVWDLNDLDAPPTLLIGHEKLIKAVAISPDSRRLITAGWDGTMRFWDLSNLSIEPIVLQTRAMFEVLAISLDNHWLVAGCYEGEIWIYNLRLNELVDLAARTLGRNLTYGEWQQYFPGQPYRKTFPNLPDGPH